MCYFFYVSMPWSPHARGFKLPRRQLRNCNSCFAIYCRIGSNSRESAWIKTTVLCWPRASTVNVLVRGLHVFSRSTQVSKWNKIKKLPTHTKSRYGKFASDIVLTDGLATKKRRCFLSAAGIRLILRTW